MVLCTIDKLNLEYSMNQVVDRIMDSSESQLVLNIASREEIRARIGSYIAMLSSAGQRDPNRLIDYGLGYLRGLHEGPDCRYSGC